MFELVELNLYRIVISLFSSVLSHDIHIFPENFPFQVENFEYDEKVIATFIFYGPATLRGYAI